MKGKESITLAPVNIALCCTVLALFAGCASEPSMNSVKQTTDQSKLASIALQSKDGSIRSSAVERLANPSVLAKIALEDESRYVRQDAVEKLTDQSVLARIALEDESPYVRQVAAERLTDQSVLARVALDDRHSTNVRLVAIYKLRDQSVLTRIALDDGHSASNRSAAITRLRDQSVLAKIVMQSKYSSADRYVALSKLRDQFVLAKIALRSREIWIREAATEKLTDQSLLARIIKYGGHERVRNAAAKRLAYLSNNEDAKNDSPPAVRNEATESDTDKQSMKTASAPPDKAELPEAPDQERCGREGISYIEDALAENNDEVNIRENAALIEHIERKLSSLGYQTGKIDGIVDRNLRAAIRCFQTMAKNTRSGSLTKALLKQLQIDQACCQ